MEDLFPFSKSSYSKTKDKVNCGYFICWYAWQLAMNKSVGKFVGDYKAVIKDIREDTENLRNITN